MVSQYPHLLQVLTSTAASQDANGNWVGGSTSWETLGKCREEVNGAGKEITLADGTSYAFSALIQLPKSSSLPKIGSTVRVMDQDNQACCEGTVKLSRKEQLHSRVWV